VTLRLPGAWVWDSWWIHDDTTLRHHLFFLHAPVSLVDPLLRHRRARIGHASSADLVTWTLHDAPLPTPAEGFDDLAQWTGCTVRDERGWWLFTSGLSRADDGRVQRIGLARSTDLETWERTSLLLEADHAHYQPTCATRPEEAWRDPWVLRDADGLWHMYITSRDVAGLEGCGVVGHATSPDLLSWTVGPALSAPTGRFDHLEVVSVVRLEGRWVLLFSCLADEMPGACPGSGGTWSVPVEGPGEPVDVASAVRLTDERWYVAHVVEHAGTAYVLAFRNTGDDGDFAGEVGDPLPVRWRADGRGLELVTQLRPVAESIEHDPGHPTGDPLV
jgi:beta-fructofuranosidase